MRGQGKCMGGWGHTWQDACVAGETAFAASSIHPTGMHSCFNIISQNRTPLCRQGLFPQPPWINIFLNLGMYHM